MADRCILCNSNDTPVILKGDKRVPASQYHVIYRYCENCSHVFLDIDYEEWKKSDDYAMSNLELGDYTTIQFQQGFEWYKYLLGFTPRTGKILDVGAATGGTLLAFSRQGWRAKGIEPNTDMVGYGNKCLGVNITKGYYSPELFPANEFSLITCYHTLEHCPRPFEAVRAFNKHLRTGGILHVVTPKLWYTDIYQLGWAHMSVFTPRTLRQILELSGFEILEYHKKSVFEPYTNSMGFVCKKVMDVGQEAYLTVGKGWKKESKLLVGLLLWVEFNIGAPKEIPFKLAEKAYRKAIKITKNGKGEVE